MPKIIIYPGTFDPIHNGHIDLIKRIALQYDKVIVAVAKDTGDKNPSLSYFDRITLVSAVLRDLELNNVEAQGFSGALADFARQQGSTTILRGVRNGQDIEFESVISNVTRSPIVSGLFKPPLEVICLISDPKYKEISSTKVRAMIWNKEDVSDLVPCSVAEKLKHSPICPADKSGASSLDWKYQAAHKALIFWGRHKQEIAVAAVSFAAGALSCRYV